MGAGQVAAGSTRSYLCSRNIHDIKDPRDVLQYEINQYNYYRVHSTTKEFPANRFNTATKANKTLFREFTLPSPF